MTLQAAGRRSDLGVRTVTGVALVLVALFCVMSGSHPFWLLILAASLLMLAEWATMIRAERWQTWLALAALMVPMLLEQPALEVPDFAGWIALAITTPLVLALTRNARLALGLVYAGLPSVALLYLHGQFDGVDLTLWTMAVVWATDIGAYFSGRTIGGPKLAPAWSPNKTWAGLIGGTACAILVGVALTRVLHVQPRLAAFSGLLAIVAQGGDLYESAMKRRAGVKDSGSILPGHGGVMDRLDGLVPVACIVAGLIAIGVV